MQHVGPHFQRTSGARKHSFPRGRLSRHLAVVSVAILQRHGATILRFSFEQKHLVGFLTTYLQNLGFFVKHKWVKSKFEKLSSQVYCVTMQCGLHHK